MKSLRSAVAALALFACADVGFVQPATAQSMMMSHSDKMTMKSCMAMSDDMMMKSHKCSMMMQKMKMTPDDMAAMKKCMAMTHDAMMADQSCTAMMKMHGMM